MSFHQLPPMLLGVATLVSASPPLAHALEGAPQSALRTPELETCDAGPTDSTVATLDMDGAALPLRPVPPPQFRSMLPSARQILHSAGWEGRALIDTRRPYGWTYTVIQEAGGEDAYAIASEGVSDLCASPLKEARQLQFNMGHTLSILWETFELNGWDDLGGAAVGIIEEGASGGATFHKEGPYLSFPSKEEDGISYGRDLSIVAHELAHGIEASAGGPGATRESADNIETAAMIESFADIIGVGIAQVLADGYQGMEEGDWRFGKDVGGKPFIRDLANPGLHGGVGHLDEILCRGDTTQTYLNSGITSKAFVRMVDGDELQGIAPLGPDHQTSLVRAMALWMDVFRLDLTPESTFSDLEGALLARAAGDPSTEASAMQALASVGLCEAMGGLCGLEPPDTIDSDFLPPAPAGFGANQEEKLGALVTQAASVDGDDSPDWLTSYVPGNGTSSKVYPIFVSGVDGIRSFTTPSLEESPFKTPLCQGIPQPMALADLNNDGQSEILLVTEGPGQSGCDLLIFEGGDSERWGSPLVQSHGLDVRGIAAGGDFNGDGVEDLLLDVGENIAILEGWGEGATPNLDSTQGLFLFQGEHSVAPQWMTALRDINDDGYSDILLSRGSESSPLMVSTAPMAFETTFLPPSTRGFSLGNLGGEADACGDFALTNTQAAIEGAPAGHRELAGELLLYLGQVNIGAGAHPQARIEGHQKEARLGRYVASHDLDGDGLREIYVTDSGEAPGYKEGRVQRFEWTGSSLLQTGTLRGSGDTSFMGRGLTAIPETEAGAAPMLLVTAPGHRPSDPEASCKILNGGGIFKVGAEDF